MGTKKPQKNTKTSYTEIQTATNVINLLFSVKQ